MTSRIKFASLRYFKNPCFTIHYEDGQTRSFTRHCDKDTAQRLLAEINNRIALGTFDFADYTATQRRSPKLRNFGIAYLEHREGQVNLNRLSRATLEHDFYSLRWLYDMLDKNIPIAQIDLSEINQVLIRAKRRYAIATINSHLKHLRGAFNWAVQKRYIIDNPFINVSLKDPNRTYKRILTGEEISKIRQALAGWKLDIFNLALWTGARRLELFRLRKSSYIRKSLPELGEVGFIELWGKGDKRRLVPLAPEAEEIIVRRCQLAEDRLFWEIETLNGITRAMKRVFHKLSLHDVKFHDCRKTFATRCLESGLSMETVMALLGHSDIRITQDEYAEVSLTKKATEMRRLRNT